MSGFESVYCKNIHCSAHYTRMSTVSAVSLPVTGDVYNLIIQCCSFLVDFQFTLGRVTETLLIHSLLSAVATGIDLS